MNDLIFHTQEYKKFIEEAFDCEYKLFAGVLPIVKIKSKLFGNKIISSAYLEYGGFCGDVGSIENIGKVLAKIKERYGKDYGYLEIRGGGLEKFDSVLSSRLVKKDLYKRFVLKLEDENIVWRKIQKSKRKAVKKALRNDNLQVKEVPFSDLNKFYNLYCRNMKQFGSPPYGKKYFVSFYKNIVANNLGKICGSYYRGKLVSALLGFYYQDRVHIVIAISDPQYQHVRPNDAMHWTFIKWACDANYQYFDFGRVREESGQFEYKRKWGPKLMDLPSYFLPLRSKEIPIVDPSHHKTLVKIWKKMPLGFTKLVGHKLRKELGI